MNQYAILFLIATLPAPYLHEGSHWFIGWLGKGDPQFNCVFWVIPNGVYFQNIEEMSPEVIRISGLAPFLWIPLALFATGLFLIEQSPYYFFAAIVPIFTVLMASESDALAFREPETFQEQVLNSEVSRTPLFFPNWILPERLPRF